MCGTFLPVTLLSEIFSGFLCVVRHATHPAEPGQLCTEKLAFLKFLHTPFEKHCLNSRCWTISAYYFFFFFFFWSFLFCRAHLQHVEVPRLGVDSELQLPVYATATAT